MGSNLARQHCRLLLSRLGLRSDRSEGRHLPMSTRKAKDD